MISKKVYISSDAFIAFIDRAHPKHVHATAFFRYFAMKNYQLYTSFVSISDAYNVVQKTIGPSIAKEFLRALSLGNFNIIYPEDSDIRNVYKTMFFYASSELSFSEALTAVLANKRSIPQICTFSYLHSLFGLTVFYLPI